MIDQVFAASNAALVELPSQKINTAAGGGIIDLVNRIIDLMISLAYPLAFFAILFIAYTLITSAGNPDAYVKSKKYIGYLVVGIFLIVFAVLGVRFVVGLLSA